MGVLQSDKVSSSSRPYSAASSSMGTVLTSLSDKMKKHWQSRPAGTAHHSYLAPKGGPGPGRYNLAAAADKVHTRSIVPRSMFLSTTPRFSEPTREQNKLGPGKED